MLVSSRYFLVLCLFFFGIGQVVYSISCYTCTDCKGTTNDWNITNSTNSSAQCFKYAYDNSAVSISYIDRGIRAPCTTGTTNTGGTYFCCSTDLCNHAITLSTPFAVLFASIVSIQLLKTIIFY